MTTENVVPRKAWKVELERLIKYRKTTYDSENATHFYGLCEDDVMVILAADRAEREAERCSWTKNWDGWFTTGCLHQWKGIVPDYNPPFCPNCGKRIEIAQEVKA